ncbi:MAG: FecR domain-containing protein [Bacteroidales bacterium]|jgi:ferric-dicitrate binding protein FerR (iron transport regulator)|nr:FecR domain-containing protein [Bacteroidales bacterium]
MTSRERDNRRTNDAWNRLYNRLDQDGLLDNTSRGVGPEMRYSRFFRSNTLRWAAAIVILIGATYFLTQELYLPTEMISIRNEEDSAAYATTLNDGSTIYLSQNTSISFPKKFRRAGREVTLEGDAYFEVSKNEKSPFVIDTRLISIEVLGTSFYVKISGQSTPSVAVNTGEVRVTLKSNGQSIRVKAGESAVLSSGLLKSVATSDSEQFSRYLNKIRFKDEKLSNVADIINRNSGGGMQIEISPELEERLITATFSGTSADSMAQMICFALNLKFTKEGESILIHQ